MQCDATRLSGILIDETEGMPSSRCYRARFGSLARAYRLVGYTPERDFEYIETNRRLRARHPELIAKIIQQLAALGTVVRRDERTDPLIINDEFTASIVLSR